MPMQGIRLVPGVNADQTPSLNETGIASCNLIRFRDGLIEKLGGWTKFYGFAIGSIVRALHAWDDPHASRLAVGAEQSLTVIADNLANDITPQTQTTEPAVDFSTTMGSNVVTIVDTGSNPTAYDIIVLETQVSVGGLVLQGPYAVFEAVDANTYTIQAASDASSSESNAGAVPEFTTTSGQAIIEVAFANHGLSVGDTVSFIVPTDVGGLTVQGLYFVNTVVDADNFTINAENTATSGDTQDMNGGDAYIVHYVSSGPTAPGTGFGIGTYGEGGYGTGVPPPANPGTPITTTDWTLDNWGSVLMACPSAGPIFYWSVDNGFFTARLIVSAPTMNGGIFVAMPQQILVAWGASVKGVQDPLLIAWSSVADFTDWTATSTNQAGTYRIPTGSRIVGGMQAPRQALIWTDVDVWSMQYIGPPFVFGFSKIGSGCGLIGKHAAGILQDTVFWMGSNQFYVLTGGTVRGIPCPVWDVVFQNLDTDNVDKIRCAPNSGFNEIAWYYPSLDSEDGENDSYVKFNTDYGWDYGSLDRTAWIDQSVVGQPIGAATNTFLYEHETSKSADGAPLLSEFTTGYAAIAEGLELPFVDWVLPDMKWGFFDGSQNASVTITLQSTDYPGDTPIDHGPYTVTQATKYINTRLRNRLVSFSLSDAGSPIDTFWRLGLVRYRGAPDGRR